MHRRGLGELHEWGQLRAREERRLGDLLDGAPLQSIDRLLQQGNAGREDLLALRREAEAMRFLARDFVALGRLQAGALTLERRPVDARSLVADVSSWPGGARTVVRVPERALPISADPARLMQALGTIVDDASRSEGEEIRLDVSGAPRGVEFTISVGVPPGDTTLQPKTTDETRVDLELARLIVEAHGGTFEFYHRPFSRGYRVVVTVPPLGPRP